MPIFKKKEFKVDEAFIPGWDNPPYCLLVNVWDIFTGLCENWNLTLKWTEPLECWWLAPVWKGLECAVLGGRLDPPLCLL